MRKMYLITANLVLVLVMIAPGTMIMAEGPPSTRDQATREGQPEVSASDEVAQKTEFRLFEKMSAPPAPTNGHGLAAADYGIVGTAATAGAKFTCTGGSGVAHLGYGDYGIDGRGNIAGGYFRSVDGTGYTYVGANDVGIVAYGHNAGGSFSDVGGSGYAYVGYGDIGVDGFGRDYGIHGTGWSTGGWFEATIGGAWAKVGNGSQGILAQGDTTGGYFADSNSSAWAEVAKSTYKIYGSGTVTFVQNHPYDQDSVIVYAAPEGDEVATYTRGMAHLVGGEATVSLGETFKWVTNPDIGLTAFLTPVIDWCDLYVAEQATDSIVVRSRDGSDCSFNYMIYGLRIGFEESSIVQEKERESYIPSMADHRQLYQRRPDLKVYNSLERFKGMRPVNGKKDELELNRAYALRDAIIEFDPAVHELPGNDDRLENGEPTSVSVTDDNYVTAIQQGYDESDHSAAAAAPCTRIDISAVPIDDQGNIYASSVRTPSQDLANLLEVSEAVEPGDVLVIDLARPGKMRRASKASDSGVVGVVAASPGFVLGMGSPKGASVEGQLDGTYRRPFDLEPAMQAPVAFSGIVRCKVDADYGNVRPGDLLVTSPTPGHAMRDELPLPGTILGKALEALEEGTGTIRVLVMLR